MLRYPGRQLLSRLILHFTCDLSVLWLSFFIFIAVSFGRPGSIWGGDRFERAGRSRNLSESRLPQSTTRPLPTRRRGSSSVFWRREKKRLSSSDLCTLCPYKIKALSEGRQGNLISLRTYIGILVAVLVLFVVRIVLAGRV